MCSQCGHYILRMCGSKTDTKRIVFDAINFAWGTLIRPHSPPHIWFSVVSGKSFKSGFQKRISSRIGPKKFVWIFETTVLTVRPDELPVKVSLTNWSSVGAWLPGQYMYMYSPITVHFRLDLVFSSLDVFQPCKPSLIIFSLIENNQMSSADPYKSVYNQVRNGPPILTVSIRSDNLATIPYD